MLGLNERRITHRPDDPPTGGNVPSEQGDNNQESSETPQTWETWIEEQPDEIKSLYAQHTLGLRNTVQATRQERDEMREQLKALSSKLEEGSDARQQLEALEQRLSEQQREANVMEQLIDPKAGINNARLALAAVRADQEAYLDRRGNVLFDKLKEDFPELFGRMNTPRGNAGSGTQKDVPGGFDMNRAIRRRAGRD